MNIVWAFSDLFEIGDFENFWIGLLVKIRALLRRFDDIWRFWGGHIKKYRENRFFFVQGGALMGVWLSGENGQDINLHKFALM